MPTDSLIKARSYFLIARLHVADSNLNSEYASVQTMSLRLDHLANGQLTLLVTDQTAIDATPEIIGRPQT